MPHGIVSPWTELSIASCSRLICSILDSFGTGGAGKGASAGEDEGVSAEETHPSNRSSKFSNRDFYRHVVHNAPPPPKPLRQTTAQRVLSRGCKCKTKHAASTSWLANPS